MDLEVGMPRIRIFEMAIGFDRHQKTKFWEALTAKKIDEKSAMHHNANAPWGFERTLNE